MAFASTIVGQVRISKLTFSPLKTLGYNGICL